MGMFEERRSGVKAAFNYEGSKDRARELIPPTQIALSVMVGGGIVGHLYATNPAKAYRDDRAGRSPYSHKDVEAVRGALVALAEVAGMDPSELPAPPAFHAAGVF